MPSVPKKPQGQSGQADKAGKADKADNDKSDDYNKSERTDTKEKSGKSDSGSQDKSDDKTSSKTQSQSKSKDKSREKSPEKGHGKSPDKDGSHEKSSSKTQSKSQDRSQEKNPEKSQDKKEKSKESDEKGDEKDTPEEGSLHEVSQQHGDVKSETLVPAPRVVPLVHYYASHALKVFLKMTDLGVLDDAQQVSNWNHISHLCRQYQVVIHEVSVWSKFRGLIFGTAAFLVSVVSTDGLPEPGTGLALRDLGGVRFMDCGTPHLHQKGISAQDESLYALGRTSKGGTRKCKHMAGPQDDLNWEELQSRLLPAFYTF
ncbi:unnamed protein product [Ixodes pacificus]